MSEKLRSYNEDESGADSGREEYLDEKQRQYWSLVGEIVVALGKSSPSLLIGLRYD